MAGGDGATEMRATARNASAWLAFRAVVRISITRRTGSWIYSHSSGLGSWSRRSHVANSSTSAPTAVRCRG